MAECIDPHALAEGQLQAYAIDPSDDDPTVVQHLDQCLACQTEVAKMQALMNHMRQELARIDCLSTETISYLAAARLTPKERRVAEAHLRQCSRCREELALSTLALADRDPLMDWVAPFPAAQAVAGVRRVIAALAEALSPGTAEPALNLRSAGTSSAARPRVYHAEDVALSLRLVAAAAGKVQIEGLISSDADPALLVAELPVRLYAEDAALPPQLVAEDTTDGGMFLLGPVAAGRFELEVQLPDRIIAVEALEL